MASKKQKISRLVEKSLKGGRGGRRIVESVHEDLVQYVGSHDSLTLEDEDCPENNPDCDPPGGSPPDG